MGTQKIDSYAKETLRNLCCGNGWSYGLFWGFDHTNSLLLTLKDAYYVGQMGAVIDNMLLQVHVLGGGVIGQAAFTRNDRWMFSEDHNERRSSLGSFQNLEVFQDDSELYCQFSMGIETIALISVEPRGVVQFGSTRKILETKDFVEQVRELFRVMDEGKFQSAEDDPASSKSQFHESTTQFMPSLSNSISHSMNQNFLHDAFSEGFLDLNNPAGVSSQLDNLFLESGNFFNFSATKELSNNSECSVVTSCWPHLTSKLSENAVFSSLNADVNLASTSLLDQDFSEEFIHYGYSDLLLDPSHCGIQRPSSLLSLEELFQENDFEEALSRSCPGDDLSQWLSPIPGPNETSFTTLINSDPRGCNSRIAISGKLVSNSQSSITDTFGMDHVKEKQQDWSETLTPVVDCDGLNFNANGTECVSEKYVGSDVGTTSNSLFSRLGLDRVLDVTASNSCTFSQSRFDTQSSSPAKRRKIESYFLGHDKVKYEDTPFFYGKRKSLNSAACLKEPGLCIDDRCSLNARNSGMSRCQDELKKTGNKKAKTGTKSRPKDRQVIQDRLVELRGLIPNGEKMSIDRLLERTIRHLNFMSGLIKHAETLKQIDKPKSGAVPKDNFSGCGGGGITWACEVGDQMMVCPLKVEDLSTPGQMLIEIRCEEQGFFLEIADLIRGFGLVILKGVLKVLESNIWAHFIVEAEENRHVTRHEIFSSLIQLLQMACQSTTNAKDPLGKVISSGISLFNHRKPTVLPT